MSFDHLPPKASTYWRELVQRMGEALRLMRSRNRQLSRENHRLQSELDRVSRERDDLLNGYSEAVVDLMRLSPQVEEMKRQLKDMNALVEEMRS